MIFFFFFFFFSSRRRHTRLVNDWSSDVCSSDLFDKAKGLLEATAREIGAPGDAGQLDVAKVSIVGTGMRTHAGIASRMFDVLSKEGINIQMISTSEIKISVVIDAKYTELAVRALHDAFIGNAPARAPEKRP